MRLKDLGLSPRQLLASLSRRTASPVLLVDLFRDLLHLRPFKKRWLLTCTPNKKVIGIEATFRCNLGCNNCDRACGIAPTNDSMTVEQVQKFIEESLSIKHKWTTIGLLGGEPTLHPKVLDMIDVIGKYRQQHHSCRVILYTNGYGKHVRDVLGKVPGWVEIVNSWKNGPVNKFRTYNVAPRDLNLYQTGDYAKGCLVLEVCGMSLSCNGYYPCAAGACVDRVFGYDIGYRSLREALQADMRDRLKVLCSMCGCFKRSVADQSDVQVTSDSWVKALEKYAQCAPKLTLY